MNPHLVLTNKTQEKQMTETKQQKTESWLKAISSLIK